MNNLWNKSDAQKFTDDLGFRVFTSRLLGKEAFCIMMKAYSSSIEGLNAFSD
jgi:rhamnose utilization protein RhaD (predicted bifunctional aldolase and dehydrogenase)